MRDGLDIAVNTLMIIALIVFIIFAIIGITLSFRPNCLVIAAQRKVDANTDEKDRAIVVTSSTGSTSTGTSGGACGGSEAGINRIKSGQILSSTEYTNSDAMTSGKTYFPARVGSQIVVFDHSGTEVFRGQSDASVLITAQPGITTFISYTNTGNPSALGVVTTGCYSLTVTQGDGSGTVSSFTTQALYTFPPSNTMPWNKSGPYLQLCIN